LLSAPPGIALLATVSAAGVPRVHPFMPRVVAGELVAFVITGSPKLRDLLEGRPCAIHSALADEDEEFWVQGRAAAVTDRGLQAAALEANHRPLHHRWIAA
jgi:hypothetical protein